MFKQISILFFILVAVQGTNDGCLSCNQTLISTDFRPKLMAGWLDGWLTDLLLKVVELLRDGLIDAGVDQIPLPDLDWILDAKLIYATFHMTENKIVGITDFILHNATVHVFQFKVDLDFEIPELEWSGHFDVSGSAVGIPLSGGGPFSLKFQRGRLDAGAQLKVPLASSVSIAIINPHLSFAGISLGFDGIFGGLSETAGIWILVGILIFYTIIVALLTIFVPIVWRMLRRKMRKSKSIS